MRTDLTIKTMNRRAVSLAPFTLLEMILGALVIVVIYFSLSSLVDSNDFYQQLYAKDNAMIAETMHVVPNGDVHIGYLWTNPNFQIALGEKTVAVQIIAKGIKANRRDKAFGTSEEVNVLDKSFVPNSFEWTLLSGQKRTLTIDQTFRAEDRCPTSTALLTGISLSARVKDFDQTVADKYALDNFESIRATIEGGSLGTFTSSGPSIVVYAIKEDTTQTFAVYSDQNTEQLARLSCLVGVAAGAQVKQLSEAPPGTPTADIVLVVSGRSEFVFEVSANILKQAVTNYVGVNS